MLPGSPSTDDDLLVRARTSAGAFSEFYMRHERAVLHYFLRRTGRPELAADLAAETFAEALRSVHRFKPGAAPALAWLFGIASHLLARSARRGAVEDRARKRLGLPRLELEDADLRRIEELAGAESPALAALAGLPTAQAVAVRARVLDEQDYTEIALELRCSEAVVRKRVSRGLAALRSQLTEGT